MPSPCAGFSTREYWYRDDDGNCHYYPDEGSDYLDDVAKYLYSNDCNPTLGAGTSFNKQNIITYTIGFALEDATKLLYRTAVNGGGEYFTAENLLRVEGGLQADHVGHRGEELLLRGAGGARQPHEPHLCRQQDLPGVFQTAAGGQLVSATSSATSSITMVPSRIPRAR